MFNSGIVALRRNLPYDNCDETLSGDADLTSTPSSNLIASVRQRLLNHSRAQHQDFNLTLTRYGIERLLYRLTASGYNRQFVLKGALLFLIWQRETWRPTRDLDLAGYGDDSIEMLRQTFTEICAVPVEPDGLRFDETSIEIEPIRELQAYPGQRIKLKAWLGQAQIPLQIDIGFGDAMVPPPVDAVYPTLLNMSSPKLQIYRRETVVAEKFQAMVILGMLNSRMKDFYDIWLMAQQFAFEGHQLVAAIEATFNRRQTPLPPVLPLALTPNFAQTPDKQKLWQAFWNRNRLNADRPEFDDVIEQIASFLDPPLLAVTSNEPFQQQWPSGGPWV